MVLFPESELHSFEYPEFPRDALPQPSFGDQAVHPVDLRLLGVYVEDLAHDRFEPFLHLRNVKIAMVCETNSSESFFRRRHSTFPYSCPASVERELAMIMCIEKHRHEYSIFCVNLWLYYIKE